MHGTNFRLDIAHQQLTAERKGGKTKSLLLRHRKGFLVFSNKFRPGTGHFGEKIEENSILRLSGSGWYGVEEVMRNRSFWKRIGELC